MKGKYITTQILIAAKKCDKKIETKVSGTNCNIIEKSAFYLM